MAYTIELYANNARTTLAGSANNTVTTLVLQSGAGALLPSPNNLIGEYAKVTLQDLATGLRNEIVYITARTGDILTVVRGQDGTAAQTWSAGDTVFEGVTAATLGNFVQPSKVQSGQYVFATATGSPIAYNAALTPAVAVLTDGMIISVDTGTVGTNTITTPTLNVNGLGVITIVKEGGELRVGDMPKFAQLQYNATLTQWVLLNPATLTSGLVAAKISIVTTTGALTTEMSGGLVRFNSAVAIVPTLPEASTYAAGKLLRLVNSNSGVATVTRAGSDTITVNDSAVNSLAMGRGDTLELISDGVSTWFAVGGTAQMRYAQSFYALKTTHGTGSGIQIFPSGLIMQTARGVNQSTFGWQTITYPMAFPTAIISASVSTLANLGIPGQGTGQFKTSESPTLTNCQVLRANADVGTGIMPVLTVWGY